MKFLRRRNPDPEAEKKRDWKGAVGDAAVVFFISLLGNLVGYGYPPTIQALYCSLTVAALMFFFAIQRKLGIEMPARALVAKE